MLLLTRPTTTRDLIILQIGRPLKLHDTEVMRRTSDRLSRTASQQLHTSPGLFTLRNGQKDT
jgi:hypothetical protein